MLKPRPSTLTLMQIAGWWAIGGSVVMGVYALLANLTLDGERYSTSSFMMVLAVFLGGAAMVALVRAIRRLP